MEVVVGKYIVDGIIKFYFMSDEQKDRVSRHFKFDDNT